MPDKKKPDTSALEKRAAELTGRLLRSLRQSHATEKALRDRANEMTEHVQRRLDQYRGVIEKKCAAGADVPDVLRDEYLNELADLKNLNRLHVGD